MARTLANIPDTQAPSSDYPKGRILDQDNTQNPPIPGTPIIEALYGDIVQFFHKLLGLAGITENNLPDNETNGYQFLAALDDYVSDKLPSITGKADKVTGAVNGNFAGLDASGNLTDSGSKAADFDAAGTAAGLIAGYGDVVTHNASEFEVAGAVSGLVSTLGDAAYKDTGTATGTVAAGDDSRFSAPKAFDRGDNAANDFTSFTLDVNWHDLDLSSIVPVGATYVLLRVFGSNTYPSNLSFRKKGNTNMINTSGIIVNANTSVFADCIVALDSNRIIQYTGTSAGGTFNIAVNVGGWFI